MDNKKLIEVTEKLIQHEILTTYTLTALSQVLHILKTLETVKEEMPEEEEHYIRDGGMLDGLKTGRNAALQECRPLLLKYKLRVEELEKGILKYSDNVLISKDLFTSLEIDKINLPKIKLRAEKAEQQLADMRGKATVEKIEEAIITVNTSKKCQDSIRKGDPVWISMGDIKKIAQAISKMLEP